MDKTHLFTRHIPWAAEVEEHLSLVIISRISFYVKNLLLRTLLAARPAVAEAFLSWAIWSSRVAHVRLAEFEVSIVRGEGCECRGHLQQLSPQRVDQIEPDAVGARWLDIQEEED